MANPERSPSPEFSPLAIGEDLAPLPQYKAAGEMALDFSGLLSEPLKLHEDLASGCGGQTWPAGVVLAKHMLRYHQHKLHAARMLVEPDPEQRRSQILRPHVYAHKMLSFEDRLELGAGGGLVGLAVARGCAVTTPLLITDQAQMLSLMEHNIALNGLRNQAKALILNWGEVLPQAVSDLKPDVILAADCAYFEPAFPLLLATLTELMALCPTCTVYFCFKKRRRADAQFLKLAQKGFHVEEAADEDRAVFSREGLFLYTFTRKIQP